MWLLRGMAPDGVLTTIDSEAEHQRAAKVAFAEQQVRPMRDPHHRGASAGRHAPARRRRLRPRAPGRRPAGGLDYLDQAVRLLRPGGLVLVPHILADDRVPDPARRDEVTTAMRELGRHGP